MDDVLNGGGVDQRGRWTKDLVCMDLGMRYNGARTKVVITYFLIRTYVFMLCCKSQGGQALLLLITVVSTAAAVVLLSREGSAADDIFSHEADGGPWSAVIAFPVHLGSSQAIALVDRKNETFSLYQYQMNRAPHERLVFLAARSYRYDRRLEDFNTAEPRPEDIRKLLEQSRGPVEQGP